MLPHSELLIGWLENEELTLTKARIKLGRMGGAVSYSLCIAMPDWSLDSEGRKLQCEWPISGIGKSLRSILAGWGCCSIPKAAVTEYSMPWWRLW